MEFNKGKGVQMLIRTVPRLTPRESPSLDPISKNKGCLYLACCPHDCYSAESHRKQPNLSIYLYELYL